MVTENWWKQIEGSPLAQGDLLRACHVPVLELDPEKLEEGTSTSKIYRYDCIVLSQSCDLDNKILLMIALCRVLTIEKFREHNPGFGKDKLENIRKGNASRLFLLSSPEAPDDPWQSLIVDFREILSLPIAYLERHAERAGPRWRLKSPYLEHLSQAFARFFMRVGLPSNIPPFK
jgi:hypothetical protein